MSHIVSTLPSFVRGLPLTREAVEYALAAHEGERRDSDSSPFVVHPLEVASLLFNRDQADEVVAAGVLHDVLEHEGGDGSDIERRFGPEVRRLVEALTDRAEDVPYTGRKARLREQIVAAGPEAALIFAADKVAKVRELRVQAGRAPERYGPGSADPDVRRRVEHYRESLLMLVAVLGAHPLVRQLRFELEMYDWLSP